MVGLDDFQEIFMLRSGVIPWEKKNHIFIWPYSPQPYIHSQPDLKQRAQTDGLATTSMSGSVTGMITNIQAEMTTSSSLLTKPGFLSHPSEVITFIHLSIKPPDMLINLFT